LVHYIVGISIFVIAALNLFFFDRIEKGAQKMPKYGMVMVAMGLMITLVWLSNFLNKIVCLQSNRSYLQCYVMQNNSYHPSQ
jgi:uncharacterized YccA/Bax inhibitor family protein